MNLDANEISGHFYTTGREKNSRIFNDFDILCASTRTHFSSLQAKHDTGLHGSGKGSWKNREVGKFSLKLKVSSETENFRCIWRVLVENRRLRMNLENCNFSWNVQKET